MSGNLAYMVYDNEICEFYDKEQLLRRVDESYRDSLPQAGSYVSILEIPDHVRWRGGYEPPSWALDVWKKPIVYRVVGYKEGITCYRSATNTLILEYKGTFREVSLIDIFSGFIKVVKVSDGICNNQKLED